jgi:predicted phosphodiesterase
MIIIGDLHGGYPDILYKIKKFQLEKTVFIQVGDWGLGFQHPDLDIRALHQIDKFLTSQQNQLYIVRGNHDNKWFWDNRDRFSFDAIKLVQDYEVMTIGHRKILFIGGGISIDRLGKIPGQGYWPDEELYFDAPLLQAACADGINTMITHIAPKEAWPYTLSPLVHHYIEKEYAAGRDLTSELENERQVMSHIYAAVKAAGCQEWYYGHYHESNVEIKDEIIFRCVAIQEMYDAH